MRDVCDTRRGKTFVDVKLDGEFLRAKVTSRKEQDEMLSRERAALDPAR